MKRLVALLTDQVREALCVEESLQQQGQPTQCARGKTAQSHLTAAAIVLNGKDFLAAAHSSIRRPCC